MITRLHIDNYALIKELDIEFDQGLNIITGETGAGKSIMLGALGLLLGNRADAKALGYKDSKCVVEAEFDISGLGLRNFFRDNDLDYDDGSILRREISASGKSRAFINDCPVGLATLKDLGERLVDIHSQHSNILLADAPFRREWLDYVGHNQEILAKYIHVYREWLEQNNQLDLLEKQARELRDKGDYNDFQLNEIVQLGIKPNEYTDNEKELDRLNNAERVTETFALINHLFDNSEHSVLTSLGSVRNALHRISHLDEGLASILQRIDQSAIELRDVYQETLHLDELWVYDQERLDYLNERQDRLQRLMRKHGLAQSDQLLLKAETLKAEQVQVSDLDAQIEAMTAQVARLYQELKDKAHIISLQRKAMAKEISPGLVHMLRALGMPSAQFSIVVTPLDRPELHGADEVEFLFSANKGHAVQAVAKVASGGEISRIMLALKALMSKSKRFPTLVFDEIDLGISGEVAIKVGELIQTLSREHQIVCITHLPQIAAMGTRHFRVSKYEDQGRSYSHIDHIKGKDRIKEIGQMIGGLNAGDNAMRSAQELLQKFAATEIRE